MYKMTTNTKIHIKIKTQELNQPTLTDICELLDCFIVYVEQVLILKKKFGKFRLPNFPEEISENIVKHIILHRSGTYPTWKPGTGDLVVDGKKVEVKCFSSSGPSSFGPTEKWDELIFLDAIDYLNKRFRCYKVKMSNIEFGVIQINQTQTFKDQCLQGKRPRITYQSLRKQIDDSQIEILFDGHIEQLSQKNDPKL